MNKLTNEINNYTAKHGRTAARLTYLLPIAQQWREALDNHTEFQWDENTGTMFAADKTLRDTFIYIVFKQSLTDDDIIRLVLLPRDPQTRAIVAEIMQDTFENPNSDYEPERLKTALILLAPAIGSQTPGLSDMAATVAAYLDLYLGETKEAAALASTAASRDKENTLARIIMTMILGDKLPAKALRLAETVNA